MTEAVKHVGLSDMAVTENTGLIPWSMQLADFEERLQEIDRELAAGEKATVILTLENLGSSNPRAKLAEESKGDKLKLLGDTSQQEKKNNSGSDVGSFTSWPYFKENKGLGLDLTNKMENNLFSIGPPSPKLKGKVVSLKVRVSQVKKIKQIRRPCNKENVGCMETEGACSAKDEDYMEVVVDYVDVGDKRKERNPLEETNMVGKENKKSKA